MKRVKFLALILVLALSALMLAGCGRSEFTMSANTGKQMIITAKNADRNDTFTVGSLQVEEGEQVTLTADLEKGEVRVEILPEPGSQSADEAVDFSVEPILTANLQTTEGSSGTLPAGDYMMRATCIAKATGTVQIDVQPAD